MKEKKKKTNLENERKEERKKERIMASTTRIHTAAPTKKKRHTLKTIMCGSGTSPSLTSLRCPRDVQIVTASSDKRNVSPSSFFSSSRREMLLRQGCSALIISALQCGVVSLSRDIPYATALLEQDDDDELLEKIRAKKAVRLTVEAQQGIHNLTNEFKM